MIIRNRVTAVQASVNASTLVAGSIMQTTYGTVLSYTIVNTGGNTISWIVYAGNTSDLSDKVVVQASADILASAASSFSVFPAPFEYYGIYILSKVGGAHGEATVRGILK